MSYPAAHDGTQTAITYPYWVKTMESLLRHPSATSSTRMLAEMCLNLIELNKFDGETIEYLNSRALQALESSNGH